MTKPVQDSLTSKDGRLNEQSTTIPSDSADSGEAFPSSVEMGPKAFGEWADKLMMGNLKNPARHYPEEDQEPAAVTAPHITKVTKPAESPPPQTRSPRLRRRRTQGRRHGRRVLNVLRKEVDMGKWRFNDPPKSLNEMVGALSLPRDTAWEEAVLAVAWGGEPNDRVLWTVVEAAHAGMTERWIECIEVDVMYSGTKVTTEAEGPLWDDCPLEFLAMVPERHPAWRARVRMATRDYGPFAFVWVSEFKKKPKKKKKEEVLSESSRSHRAET